MKILRTFICGVILLGILVLGLFTYDAFDYYIIKTTTQEDSRQIERRLFLICLEDLSSVARFQADQIQKLTEENVDLQIENLKLRSAVKKSIEIIRRLARQIECYENPNNGIFEPDKDKEA